MVSSSTTISASFASKRSGSPPTPPQRNQRKITIRVKNQQGGEEDIYKIGYTSHFSKLIDAHCTKRNIEKGTGRFIFRNKGLKPRSTPAQLEMEDGDIIDVVTDQDGA